MTASQDYFKRRTLLFAKLKEKTSMRWTLGILLLWLLIPLSHEAQTLRCDHMIIADSLVGNSHYLQTRFLHTIARSTYSYYFRFRTESDKYYLDVQAVNGGTITKKHEIVVLNRNMERRRYHFTGTGQSVSANPTETHQNFVRLDLADIKWLASNKISTFYLVDHNHNKIRKLSPPADQQEELLTAVRCFLERLTPASH